MARNSNPEPDLEEEVGDEVDWLVDADGVEYFMEDGVRYDLADDGYAYPVEEAKPAPKPAASKPATKSATKAAPSSSAKTDTAKSKATSGRSSLKGSVAASITPADTKSAKSTTAKSTTAKSTAAKATPAKPPAGTTKDAPPFSKGAAATTAPRTAPAPAAEPEVLLKLEAIESGYGSLPVLHGVSTEIRVGETAVLLGLNGAGKTTTALNICGALGTWGGKITYAGQDSTNWTLKECVQNGIIMCPEGRRVFPALSVQRNLAIGSWMKRKDQDWVAAQQEIVFDYFPRLRQRTAQLAGSLSGGEQQMLAMGRALMAQPRLLIVDEASMGLAPVIVKDVFDIIADINKDGVTVLLIEQNVGALDVAQLGLVMEQGRMVKELRGERLKDRSEVTEVLMG